MSDTDMNSGCPSNRSQVGNNTPKSKLTPELRSYRDFLVKAKEKGSEAYDKAVMTLSGGALAISLTFINDIIPCPKLGTVVLLVIGWALLALSIVAILVSMLTSQWALGKAIDQVDNGEIYSETAGAGYTAITAKLNAAAGIFFIFGVFFLAWFAIVNMTQ